MNNYERIKAMTIDEMGYYFCKLVSYCAGGCEACPYCERKNCGISNPFKQWLQQESEGNNAR